MRTTAMLLGLVAAGWGAVAIAQTDPRRDPLATRSGWDVGGQLARYRYEEPGLMHLTGERIGATVAYTVANARRNYMRFELRYSYGELEYQGSGTLDGAPDHLFEVRSLAGRDFRTGALVWSPYAGFGVRYLYNDLRGITSTGAIGYQRESNYFYVPLGITLRVPLGEHWVLAPQIEYDGFLKGAQHSYLSDTGLGFNNATNWQRHGRGYRAQLMFEGRRWSVGPWMNYWQIKDSEIQPIGAGFIGWEPENWTREAGVELRYRF